MIDSIYEIGPGHFVDLDKIVAMADADGDGWWFAYEAPPITQVTNPSYVKFEEAFAAWNAFHETKRRLALAAQMVAGYCACDTSVKNAVKSGIEAAELLTTSINAPRESL